jgi:hypothetical protein
VARLFNKNMLVEAAEMHFGDLGNTPNNLIKITA